MADTVTCAQCGQENLATQRFCGACGHAMVRACPTCGEANPAGFRFCGSCGAGLDQSAASAPLTEERRLATVLFADLSGFTNYSERTDPEDVKVMVDRCMRRMGDAVESFGASVTRVVGDELMALFGAPVSHEDDAERAVRAGLEIQRLAEEHREEFGGLAVRVGINTGEMMFAPVGPDGSFTVMGDAVNVAARLQRRPPWAGSSSAPPRRRPPPGPSPMSRWSPSPSKARPSPSRPPWPSRLWPPGPTRTPPSRWWGGTPNWACCATRGRGCARSGARTWSASWGRPGWARPACTGNSPPRCARAGAVRCPAGRSPTGRAPDGAPSPSSSGPWRASSSRTRCRWPARSSPTRWRPCSRTSRPPPSPPIWRR